jgi:CDP-diacylglycerol--serine O-phosphatidyltransferase
MAIVLISYSPPEVLFFVSFVYALSGYVFWLLQKVGPKESQQNLSEP